MPHYEERVKNLLDSMHNHTWTVYTDGGEIEKGYKPDRVYEYRSGAQWLIVEIEAHTSRKGFIGGALKAAKHFDEYEDGNGKFIYIVSSRNFDNLEALLGQMTPALDWLQSYGIPVPRTYIVHDKTVGQLKRERIKFPSVQFFTKCIEV